MRPALFLLPLIGLTACASPQERCINTVAREIGTIGALIVQTQGNIDRGFAIEQRQETREINRICRGRTESGEEVRVRCEDVQVRNVNVPVTIDLEAEQTKLTQLQDRQRDLRAQSGAAIAQCRAQFPET